MVSAMKLVIGFLAFVTIGMITGQVLGFELLYSVWVVQRKMIFRPTLDPLMHPEEGGVGALFQLAIINKLEDSYGSGLPSKRIMQELRHNGHLKLPTGISNWDEEAAVLRIGLVKPEVISWSPRIFVLHNFLSTEECDYLRAIALPRLEISHVVDPETGKGVKSNIRTSSGTFLRPKERKYPMIQTIEKRISVYAQVPIENGEFIQVLRYEKGQFYKPHLDYFHDEFNAKNGGQRIATMLMYLTNNVEGGETHFPLASSGNCSCGRETTTGLSVKPVKGDAILFWSMGLDGQSDTKSLHGACEVLSGAK